MTRPADYRVPTTDQPGHIYLSANSLAWNRATGEQGHTVTIGARLTGHAETIALIPPEPVEVDPESTVVMATAAVPQIWTVDELERELRRPARQDPPIYAGMLAGVGMPVYAPDVDDAPEFDLAGGAQ